jgi:hypothetical protein
MSKCRKICEVWAGGDRIGALRIAARFFDRSVDTQIFKRGMDARNHPRLLSPASSRPRSNHSYRTSVVGEEVQSNASLIS